MASNTAAASDMLDRGSVMNVINKRLHALRKKYNRIVQMEESVSQVKTLNKEQEDVLRSKPIVTALIDELDKLCSPLSSALSEELALYHNHMHQSPPYTADNELSQVKNDSNDSFVSDMLNLFYFGSLFDVESHSDFTTTMLTRTHDRGCCLTYDYVTVDATDLLGERDANSVRIKLAKRAIHKPCTSHIGLLKNEPCSRLAQAMNLHVINVWALRNFYGPLKSSPLAEAFMIK